MPPCRAHKVAYALRHSLCQSAVQRADNAASSPKGKTGFGYARKRPSPRPRRRPSPNSSVESWLPKHDSMAVLPEPSLWIAANSSGVLVTQRRVRSGHSETGDDAVSGRGIVSRDRIGRSARPTPQNSRNKLLAAAASRQPCSPRNVYERRPPKNGQANRIRYLFPASRSSAMLPSCWGSRATALSERQLRIFCPLGARTRMIPA